MTEKRFIGYDFGEYENRNYAVYDLSKSEKTKEDFWDNEEECYDIWAFVDYLEENDCVLSCDEVVGLLNKLYEENEQLKKELSECEKFRYSVFKRIEKTIESKDNCVLNKDAKSPCKDYDKCLKIQGTNKPLPCVVNWLMGRPFENMLRKERDDE